MSKMSFGVVSGGGLVAGDFRIAGRAGFRNGRVG